MIEKEKNFNYYFFSVNQYKNGDYIKSIYFKERKYQIKKNILFSIIKPKFEEYISIYILIDVYKYQFYCKYKINLETKTYMIQSVPIGKASCDFYYINILNNKIIEHWKDIISVYYWIREMNIFEVRKFFHRLIKSKIYSIILYIDTIEEKLKNLKNICLILNSNFKQINQYYIEKQLTSTIIQNYINDNFNLLTNYLEEIILFIVPDLGKNFNFSCKECLYSISNDTIKKVKGETNISISLNILNYYISYQDEKNYFEINKKDGIFHFISDRNINDFIISKKKIIYKNYNYIEEKENKLYFGRYYNNNKFFDGCIINKKDNNIEYGIFENGKLINKNSFSKGTFDLSLTINEEGEVLLPYV